MSKENRQVKRNNFYFKDLWEKYNMKWVVLISIWTFILAIIISIFAEIILTNTKIGIAFFSIFTIILIGVVGDMVGIAITAANEKPFHAMASDKIEGAKYAIRLLKNAGIVSNFCNDVVGDICGIVSGAAGASIILKFENLSLPSFLGEPINRTMLTIILGGLIASLTVGGKAIGKNIAIAKTNSIVLATAKLLSLINKKTGIDFLPKARKKKMRK